jgi:hypothetical protein
VGGLHCRLYGHARLATGHRRCDRRTRGQRSQSLVLSSEAPVCSPKISATSAARDLWKRTAAKPAVSRACRSTTRNSTERLTRPQSPQGFRNFGKRLPVSICALNWEITTVSHGLASGQITEKLLEAILTSASQLRSTPKRGPKSYLKFAPRFIGVSEDADAVPGLDDDELVSPA